MVPTQTGDDLKTLEFATWNILGDDLDQVSRLKLISQEIRDMDFIAIQEVIIDEDKGFNSAESLSRFSGLKLASCASGEVANLISGKTQGTAILTSLEVFKPNISIAAPAKKTKMHSQEYKKYAAAILRTPNNLFILVCSVHLPWGASNEIRRIEHVRYIDLQMAEIMKTLPEGSISILAGDFNCTPNSESIRYLKGETVYKGGSTFWIDVWDETGKGPGFTFDPSMNNNNLNETAFRNGILSPELMPARRLDYAFISGWVFGKHGSPLSSRLLGDKPNDEGAFGSDHFGVAVKIWNPN
jgi:endonuclease/exonuclease/phosphatase family metal-dependent hydrolase